MTPAGALVELRGETWLVAQAERFDGCTVLTLVGCGHGNAGARWRAIEPFDRPTVPPGDRPRVRRRDTVLRAALAAVARQQPVAGLWAAARARLTLLPYQLEPALAALDGATRLLLADAVGLGKTIQAALIAAELQARGLVERTLILTPAGLRDTWAEELVGRFAMRPIVFDQAVVAGSMALLPVGANPWTAHAVIIASIDLVKRAEVLAAVEAAPFDLLIVDEAHHLTPGSDRGAAVQRLATRVPWLVLVSATPHSGDQSAFAYLTGLGARGETLTVFRRSLRDVGRTHDRREHLLAVRLTPEEAALHASTEAYARAIWQAGGVADPAVRLVATTLARRAASSAAALERTLVRRLAVLSGRLDPQDWQASLPWEDTDDTDGDEDAAALGRPGLREAGDERQWLEALVDLAREASRSASKFGRILRLLGRVSAPVVIFTEYRDTLGALARICGGRSRVATVHGGQTPAIRQAAVDALNAGAIDVLIATDAAGEGLNLHHRCRLVVNLELPWNPVRLEQRVGRVDRIGQTRRVHALHLYHRGTIEDTVLARLERRRRHAGAAIAASDRGWAGEDTIARAAFDGSSVPIQPWPAIATHTVSRARAEAARLEGQRALLARCSHAPPTDAVQARPGRRERSTRRVVFLYDIRHIDGHGRLLAQQAAPILIDLAQAPGNRRDWRLLIGQLRDHPTIRTAVDRVGRLGAAEVERALGWRRMPIVRRLVALKTALGRERPSLVQGALFDRRAERDALTRRELADRLDAHLGRRADSLGDQAPSRTESHTQMVAAWTWQD